MVPGLCKECGTPTYFYCFLLEEYTGFFLCRDCHGIPRFYDFGIVRGGPLALRGRVAITVEDGGCPMCGWLHREDAPHNSDSLLYQLNFFDDNGRWPTWEDGMAHCTKKVKERWREMLAHRRQEYITEEDTYEQHAPATSRGLH